MQSNQNLIRQMLAWCGVIWLFGPWACAPDTTLLPVPSSSWGTRTQAIVGGTKDLRYPAVGALTLQRNSFCTATLIRPNVVISAGHCIDNFQSQPSRVQFRVDRPDGQGGFTSTFHNIKSAQNHPLYKLSPRGGIMYDVGLIFLQQAITDVTPLPLNKQALPSPPKAGSTLLFLGYGLTQTKPSPQAAPHKFGLTFPLTHVYADRVEVFAKNKSICSGDSGGPALELRQSKPVLVAINSYVRSNNQGRLLYCDGSGVSFRVDTIIPWIEATIAQNAATCNKDAECGSCGRCTGQTCTLTNTKPAQSPKSCQPCQSDKDCGDTQYQCVRLNEGYRCLPKCNAASCCPSGMFCKNQHFFFKQHPNTCLPNNFKCPAFPCTTDVECGKDGRCNNGRCTAPAPRLARFFCQFCQSDSDCAPTSRCIQRPEGKVCLDACGPTHPICYSGYTCAKVGKQQLCLPRTNQQRCLCQKDDDCLPQQVCRQGQCRSPGIRSEGQSCQNSGQCKAGLDCVQVSAGQFQCALTCSPAGSFRPGMPGSGCNQSSCEVGAQCFGLGNGQDICLRTCRANQDCIAGGQCQNVGGGIRACICRQDSDCNQSKHCNSSKIPNFGSCSPPPTHTSTCRPGQRCLRIGAKHYCTGTPTAGCVSDADCPPQHLCSRMQCIPERRCGPGLPCPAKQICQLNGLCGVDPESCTKDDQCGPGTRCVQGICQPGAVPEPKPEAEPEASSEPVSRSEPEVTQEQAPKSPQERTPEPRREVSREIVSDAGQARDLAKDTKAGVTTVGCGCQQTRTSPLSLFLAFLLLWPLLTFRRRKR